MRSEFIFDANREQLADYVTRMALVEDSIINGVVNPNTGENYAKTLTPEEQVEVKQKVYMEIRPIVLKEVKVYFSKNAKKWEQLKEDISNEVEMRIMEKLYKYNNPRFKNTSGECALATFIHNYIPGCVSEVVSRDSGITMRESKNRGMINRTKHFIAKKENISLEAVTPEMVYENIESVTGRQLSLDSINSIYYGMQTILDIADENCDVEYDAGYDEIHFASPKATNAIESYIGMLRPVQQFIMCQKCSCCSAKYADMSLEELACDEKFLEIVMEDHIGAKHFDEKEKRIDVPFLDHQRGRCKTLLVKVMQNYELDDYDLVATIPELLRKTWNKLADSYKLD